MIEARYLSSYLNDHLTGSSAGADLFRRAAKKHRGTTRGPELAELSEEVSEDQARLREIMRSLDVRENRPMMLLARVGEKAARLKPNAQLMRRSRLSDLVELEVLRLAVAGKSAGWQALRAAAESDSRLPKDELDELHSRAEKQIDRLRTLHLNMAKELFKGGGS